MGGKLFYVDNLSIRNKNIMILSENIKGGTAMIYKVDYVDGNNEGKAHFKMTTKTLLAECGCESLRDLSDLSKKEIMEGLGYWS